MNKKIDIEKSTVYGTNDKDNVDLWLGIKGYFSHYSDFEPYRKGELDGFTRSQCMTIEKDPSGCSVEQWYNYFIPEDKVVFKEEKPKKLRPFKDIEEFRCTLGCAVGDVITYKKRNRDTEYSMLFSGYALAKDGDVLIYLGAKYYVLKELCDDYLYYRNGEWKPFGVEEDEA